MVIDEEIDLKRNVLQWYPIKENSTILQIGFESYEVIDEMCKKVEDVTLIVTSEEQKEEILQKAKYENLEIIVEQDLEKIEQKYDYVSLIGTIKIYQDILEEKAYKRLQKLLKIANKICKDTGKILLTVDNKYGMKFWTTMYAQKNILCNQKFALSKTMIEQLLKEANLTNYKFYYMLPDYKITNVIFTDNFLPNVESIHRDFTYGEEEFSTFNEIEGFEEILKENKELFKFYSNSYFIEIGKSDLEENDIKFVTYTNIRKEKYRIKTIIYKDRVEKTYNNEKAEAHINQIKRNIDIMNELKIKTLDTYENEKIISKYVENGKSYDKILLEYLEQENNEKFFSEIKTYQNRITKILKNVDYVQIKENNVFTKYNVECEEELLEKLHFVKHGLWDLIFQNAFYINNDLYFYDQEWYEENIPVEYIIYRAIAYFPNAHAYIPTNKLYETLEIEKYIQIFQELDNKIQDEIRDNKIWECHNRTKTGQTLMDLYYNLQKEYVNYKKEHENINIDELVKENTQLKNKNIELEKQKENFVNETKSLTDTVNVLKGLNDRMANSASWKITKPLRWIRRKF